MYTISLMFIRSPKTGTFLISLDHIVQCDWHKECAECYVNYNNDIKYVKNHTGLSTFNKRINYKRVYQNHSKLLMCCHSISQNHRSPWGLLTEIWFDLSETGAVDLIIGTQVYILIDWLKTILCYRNEYIHACLYILLSKTYCQLTHS